MENFESCGRFRGVRSIFPALPGARAGAPEPPYVTRRVVTPKSNTGPGSTAEQLGHAPNMRFGSSRAPGALANAYFENPSGLVNSNVVWLGTVLV